MSRVLLISNNSCDLIVSNHVLETEHGEIISRIAQLRAAGSPVPVELSEMFEGYQVLHIALTIAANKCARYISSIWCDND